MCVKRSFSNFQKIIKMFSSLIPILTLSFSSFVMIKVETIHSLFFLLILSFDPTLRLEQKNLNKINPSCKTFQRQFHHLRKVRKVEQDLVARGSTKSLFNKVRVNRALCVLSCALLLLFNGLKQCISETKKNDVKVQYLYDNPKYFFLLRLLQSIH